ncbi:MAG: hypothetical protein MUE79_07105 [Nitratireductor sp.]|nr:hypothetical protein [Nitratireductor sp.]
MTRFPLLAASAVAGLLFASSTIAQPFQASSRVFQPIAQSHELVLPGTGPRFHGLDRFEGEERLVREQRYRDCQPGLESGKDFVIAIRFCAG